jgi:hypothetical protein
MRGLVRIDRKGSQSTVVRPHGAPEHDKRPRRQGNRAPRPAGSIRAGAPVTPPPHHRVSRGRTVRTASREPRATPRSRPGLPGRGLPDHLGRGHTVGYRQDLIPMTTRARRGILHARLQRWGQGLLEGYPGPLGSLRLYSLRWPGRDGPRKAPRAHAQGAANTRSSRQNRSAEVSVVSPTATPPKTRKERPSRKAGATQESTTNTTMSAALAQNTSRYRSDRVFRKGTVPRRQTARSCTHHPLLSDARLPTIR